jgi:NAD(P)-dependent dehydrogenase (short-subunit alcohol dehydrogenase family)
VNRLKGKSAIVAGGACGLGKVIATRMAEEGAAVFILDAEAAESWALAHCLRERGLSAYYARCNVETESEVACHFPAIVTELGGLDVLVNADVSPAGEPAREASETKGDFARAVNVKGVFFCTKHAIPCMRRAGGGSIIYVSSIYGLTGAPDVPTDPTSKGAIRLMTKDDARRYAADHIRVNAIRFGFVGTPALEAFKRPEAVVDGRKQLVSAHPVGQIGEPDDVAWAAVYLASDEAKFVTGSELIVDGGYTELSSA